MGNFFHICVSDDTFKFFDYRAYKTIVEDDLKFPLIYGEGKKVIDLKW